MFAFKYEQTQIYKCDQAGNKAFIYKDNKKKIETKK